jgi:hypothetical protein
LAQSGPDAASWPFSGVFSPPPIHPILPSVSSPWIYLLEDVGPSLGLFFDGLRWLVLPLVVMYFSSLLVGGTGLSVFLAVELRYTRLPAVQGYGLYPILPITVACSPTILLVTDPGVGDSSSGVRTLFVAVLGVFPVNSALLSSVLTM